MSIIDTYEEILQGKRKRFPKGTWNFSSDGVKLVKYLIEEKLQWSVEDIKKRLNHKVFKKLKLGGMLEYVFNNSPYAALDAAYPGQFKPWELQQTPQGFWTVEMGIVATRWLIEEKLCWSIIDLKHLLCVNTFNDNNLGGMLYIVFDKSPYSAVNAAYPGKFKPWELNKTPLNFWNRAAGIEATRWLMQEELKWSDEDIKDKLSGNTFAENGLQGMLHTVFNGSPFAALDAAYPDKLKPWELRKVPQHFWSLETSVDAVRWLIEEKLKWSEMDIKKSLSESIFVRNNLSGMLQHVFKDSPYAAINAAYPGKFKPIDFKGKPKTNHSKR
ncbi:hypothetical protein [Paenibacillus cremeus]|uniref:DUF4046 domain-containing protein n=1 Tax=Paenibacillus cremeus TaxID=2163881 RepID=A0A559JGK5_9BACL|nr:hypothetical protein [Paenibacillus cremeus]TVX99004.1 hypothetical protein FPZ49_34155 [Paenibacillus cremeus]